MTPDEVVQVLLAEGERQQNVTPRLRAKVATARGQYTVYLCPVVDGRPGLVEFGVWALLDARYESGVRSADMRILSVRGA